jgi:lipid II isoglutaminyl synthase (glutamine-hydrolysing)
MNIFLIVFGKLFSTVIRFLGKGSGSTWPGHIALNVNKSFIKQLTAQSPELKAILIAGTNGKTTTAKMIRTVLEKSGKKVFQNDSGANLLNGIASSFILHSTLFGKINYDYAVFEIDENTLPLILKEIKNPNYVIILNLFRDQLDRYGEVNSIAEKWEDAIQRLPSDVRLILNADDPQVANLNSAHRKTKNTQGGVSDPPLRWTRYDTFVYYFGVSVNEKNSDSNSSQHASDSIYCPKCSSKLLFSAVSYSHLGVWKCPKCKLNRPKPDVSEFSFYPLEGIYNKYNTHAAVLALKKIGISEDKIKKALQDFHPAFGRQEVLNIHGKKVKIFLSKNPTSFNESLRAISNLKAKNLLLVLNDRIPDGRDISWIWDVDFEKHVDSFDSIVVSGDRAYDLALRLRYATKVQSSKSCLAGRQVKAQSYSASWRTKFKIEEDLKTAVNLSLENLSKSETLYILPTYSAMLEVRKILTGKKIL